MAGVPAVHEEEGAPVVAVADPAAHGLVCGPEGVHGVPAFAQASAFVVEVPHLRLHHESDS